METHIFLAADYANVDGITGKLNILGAFDRIYAKEFPVRHRILHLVIKLSAELGDVSDTTRQMMVRLMDIDANEVYAIQPFEFKIPLTDKGTRPEVNAIIEIRDLEFPRSGRYEFQVLVDNLQLGALPLDLEQLPPNSLGD